MAKTADRTDPALWERIKLRVTAGAKGGAAGEWSARKAQLAVAEYKAAGGSYRGPRDPANALHRWTEEDWGTKSGQDSADTGERYLPRDARAALSDADYRRTTARKRRDTAKGRQFSAQPGDVAAKTARFRGARKASTEPTKAQLYARARKAKIAGRSTMNKAQLRRALARQS